MKMKSKLFSAFDVTEKDNEAFKDDMLAFFDCTDNQKTSIVKVLPDLANVTTQSELDKISESLVSETSLTKIQLRKIIRFVGFFTQQLINKDLEGDTPDLWANDLEEANILNGDGKHQFINFVNIIKAEVSQKINDIKDSRTYEAGILPTIRSLGTTVELRGVFKKSFSFGEILEDYTPELKSILPVASIRMSFDSGHVKEVAFQATPKELELLINKLSACLEDSRKLEKSVSLLD
jgi:hypothetical protein